MCVPAAQTIPSWLGRSLPQSGLRLRPEFRAPDERWRRATLLADDVTGLQ